MKIARSACARPWERIGSRLSVAFSGAADSGHNAREKWSGNEARKESFAYSPLLALYN